MATSMRSVELYIVGENKDMNFDLYVLDTLKKATSQNLEILKPAEQQLKSWETHPGFYTTLLKIFSNHSIDVTVRWLAVLYFKNGIEKYWRRNAPNEISENEKRVIRLKLISEFNEPFQQVAVQLAILISKIARLDCPRDWPELFPALVQALNTTEELQQQRVLLTLHYVVKAMCAKRLAGDRRIFQDITSRLFGYIFDVWNNHTQMFLQSASQKDQSMAASLEKALFSFKILRKLVVNGYKEPHMVPQAVQFLSLVFQYIRPLLQCRKDFQHNDTLREKCEKYLILLTKVLHDVLHHHPFSYVEFIRPSLTFIVQLCFTAEGNGFLFERFIVQCLNLMKKILQCIEYQPAKLPEVTKEPATLKAHSIKMEFFSHNTLIEICQQLVSKYFLLTEEDISIWENDPESFAIDEGGESWKFNLRPCTESLFLTLNHEFRQTVVPYIIEIMGSIQNMNSTTDVQAILQKDAVYAAVGLAANLLYEDVDFDSWFVQVLIPELRIKDNNYRIIRHRVIWLIGEWIKVKLSPGMRPALYEELVLLLDTQEDTVVRLAATKTLKIAVEDFDFNIEQFLPFIEPIVNRLYLLLKESRECDTKMNVLHVLSFMIERVGIQIRPYASSLINYLPLLWENSSDHNMLRCCILTNLVHLVQGLGTMSETIHSFLLPVIALSTDISQPSEVYLLEDGLALLQATLENTSRCNPELLEIANNLFPIMDRGSESVKTCMVILQCYILLVPEKFMQRYGTKMVEVFCNIVSDMRTEGLQSIMKLLELIFRVFPEEGPHLFQPFLPHVLEGIMEEQGYNTLLGMQLSVLSRVVMHNQSCFTFLLQERARLKKQQTEDVLSSLLDVWLNKASLVNPVERKKLIALALTSLITSNSSIVYDRICGILNAVVEALHDVTKTDDIGACLDSLILDANDIQQVDNDEETEHERRKRELSHQDPVHTVILKEYLSSQMSRLQQSLGQTAFEQLMSTVDIETMQQLKMYLQS